MLFPEILTPYRHWLVLVLSVCLLEEAAVLGSGAHGQETLPATPGQAPTALGGKDASQACATQYTLPTDHPRHGGTYRLVLGHDQYVCQVYAKNLAHFASLALPMACTRCYHPTVTEFSTPTWQPLDWSQHATLYKKVLRYHEEHRLSKEEGHLSKEELEAHKKDVEAYLAEAEERAKNLGVSLFLGRFDVNNDGHLDNVLAIRSIACGPYWFLYKAPPDTIARYAAQGVETDLYTTVRDALSVYLLNDTLSDLDYALQDGLFGEGGGGYSYGVFFYQGRTYLDTFTPQISRAFFDDGYLDVYDGTSLLHQPVCRFEYLPHEKGRRP
jgi:hypothetical protein